MKWIKTVKSQYNDFFVYNSELHTRVENKFEFMNIFNYRRRCSGTPAIYPLSTAGWCQEGQPVTKISLMNEQPPDGDWSTCVWVNSCEVSPKVGYLPWSIQPTLA